MMISSLKIVVFGLSITSSWGNGHATTYRGLVNKLIAKGHDVRFLERDVPWYSANRDLPDSLAIHTQLYKNIRELKSRFSKLIREADLVMVGSYVPEGVKISEWIVDTARGVTAFYDIDTPVTIAKLESNDFEYLSRDLIPNFQLYFSFTGGPILQFLEQVYGAQKALPLYCSVDPDIYYPEKRKLDWHLGYLGTFSRDRQQQLDNLLMEPARSWKEGTFVVAGPLYPESMIWPENIQRYEHIPPYKHRAFYNSQKFTLNITRAPMVKAGHSPSVRLFEAAACGTPIISDYWDGLDCFFEPEKEILVARNSDQILRYLRDLSEENRHLIGRRARARILKEHTAAHRAEQLENSVLQILYGKDWLEDARKGKKYFSLRRKMVSA